MFTQLIYESLSGSDKIKSKDYSVLINTIYDHRVKHNVMFKNVNQVIANSNNTAQTTEAIYDMVFYGTIIDCYETTKDEGNYIISHRTEVILANQYF